MSWDDFPILQTDLAVIHLLVVSDQDRSSEFYRQCSGRRSSSTAIGSS